ncbi:hypothetical protein [Snodgrassella sp. CS2]
MSKILQFIVFALAGAISGIGSDILLTPLPLAAVLVNRILLPTAG